MQKHQEKVLAHAAERLSAITSLTEPSEVSGRFRDFLRVEDRRLRIAHRMGADGRWVAAARSFVLDVFVSHVFELAQPPAGSGPLDEAQHGCAVIAIGEYGRRELAPFSDLDLLFLHTGRRSVQTREMLERILHLLWDAGLSICHRSQTVEECVSAARNDPHLQTALINARLLVGNSTLFDSLLNALERSRRKSAGALIAAARQQRAEQSYKLGAAVYLQEPNVKESAGGLRDLHCALWAAYARYGCRTLEDLRAQEIISEDEARRVVRADDFLQRVRHEAHWSTGRKTDRLALDLQPVLAERFGYKPSAHLLASEQFMRDYYRHARELHLFSESLLERAAGRQDRPAHPSSQPRREHLAEAFSIKNRQLQLDTDPHLLTKNPLLFFEAVALAQTAEATFGHDLREAISRSLAAIDQSFRGSTKAAQAFLALLRRRGRVGHALRLMHEVGFLGRYLPEFGRISFLIQHDLYHHYTIDEHTLRAVEALDDLANTQDRARAHLRAAFDEVEDVALLYLSALLHDVGKGRGSGHVARGAHLAERICQRLHLDAASAAKVVLTVKHHVLMAHVSQRRDLREPHLAADFAASLGSLETLNMLFLLTYADLNGIGPGVWSDWKGTLLQELYERARIHLVGGQVPLAVAEDLMQFKQQVINLISDELPLSEIERHLALLPDRYVRATSPSDAATHLRLIKRLRSEALVCRWLQHTGAITELTVCTRDRRGLFADLAGALAAQGIEILSADLNTRGDGIVIDNFMLREAATHSAVEKPRWARIERALLMALTGESDVAALVERWRTRNAPRRRRALALRPRTAPRVICDNEAARAATMVEVRAADEHGLAYRIASTLAALGLDIDCAKIATEKSDALDVFYVTNANGLKLSEAEMRAVEEALTRSLAATEGETLNLARDGTEVTAG
ncbi:MAG TPA: [protein-PII] uridylyltransferase [Pyrinomonadaceae bacterium]|nr:[protein-PII] uridylyltransferase [Pyrinomonadaceae bacterium]